MRFPLPNRFLPFLALTGALVLGACDDDPVSSAEEHSEPAVVEISFGGQGDVVVARAFVGSSTGFIGAQVNQETADLYVDFLDDESVLIVPGSGEYLEVVLADESVAVWEAESAGAFRGRFSGLSVGETTAVFRFMHGSPGSGHPDFESHPVNVIIN